MARRIPLPDKFVAFDNVLLERLINLTVSSGELRCALFVYRQTIGWDKHVDAISLSQFAKACHLTKRAVCKILIKLEQKNIIARERKDTGDSSKFKFNQDFNTWRVGNRGSYVVNTGSATSERAFHKVVNGRSYTKEIKETLTKERPLPLKKSIGERGFLD